MTVLLPSVTVVVPVYNSAPTLERALRSVLRQTLKSIEVLVLDDGSTDDGVAVATRLAGEDTRIRVIVASANAGKPAAMNRMIAEATGNWIAVLDADDAYHDDRLRILITAAEAAKVDLIVDNIVYIDAGTDTVVRTAFDSTTPDRLVGLADFWLHSNPHAEFDFGILKPVIRRDFLLKHGLTYYQTSLSEDFYYLMNVFLSGGRGLLLSQALYFWTMPFGPLSRVWTNTGNGAWRYNYRDALAANDYFISKSRLQSDTITVKHLKRRGRQYKIMRHYLEAQQAAAFGKYSRSVFIIILHPSTYFLLASRVTGRLLRFVKSSPPKRLTLPHPKFHS